MIATLNNTSLVTDIAVHCRGVSKDFGDGETRIRVLNAIDLQVPAGEMSLLVGPSGCGKTTLISIIAGLLEPTDGDVTLFGTPLFIVRAAIDRLSGRQHRLRLPTIQFAPASPPPPTWRFRC